MPQIPEFNQEKYILGDICLRGHNWFDTGYSLRRKHHKDCLDCRQLAKLNDRYKRRTELNISVSIDEIDTRTKQFAGMCAYCGSERWMGLDHFVPISKGGTHTIDNLVPCCYLCNGSKKCSDAKNWYKSRDFYSQEKWDYIIKVLNEPLVIPPRISKSQKLFNLCNSLHSQGIEVNPQNLIKALGGQKISINTIRQSSHYWHLARLY